jgi:hypothetical protein
MSDADNPRSAITFFQRATLQVEVESGWEVAVTLETPDHLSSPKAIRAETKACVKLVQTSEIAEELEAHVFTNR